MAIDSAAPRSRRVLLAGAVGGVSALVVGAFGRPLPASAAPPKVTLGGTNSTGGLTAIASSNQTAFRARTTSSSGHATGVWGQTGDTDGNGVYGYASSAGGTPAGVRGFVRAPGGAGTVGIGPGRGVSGHASGTAGRGVLGAATSPTGETFGVDGVAVSPMGVGVQGRNSAASGQAIGVRGSSSASAEGIGVWAEGNQFGLFGTNSETTGAAVGAVALASHGIVADTLKTAGGIGVWGRSGSDDLGIGVAGDSTSLLGTGVRGRATEADGTGVEGRAEGTGLGVGVSGYALSDTGIAVRGTVDGATGIAGQFQASAGAGSMALKVIGRAEFSTCGIATIASGNSSVVVSPGVEVTTNSKLLATLQGSAGGTTTISYADRNTGANTFTIHLTANATGSCDVAWFVIG